MIDIMHIKYHMKWLPHIIKLHRIIGDKGKRNFLNGTRSIVTHKTESGRGTFVFTKP
jgi:hypothetical protein